MHNEILHIFVYKVLRIAIKPYLWLKFNYRSTRAADIPVPSIILVNHTSPWDPFFVASAFPEHMYFLSGAHVLRWGLRGRLISFLAAPIPYPKTAGELKAVQRILFTLRSGKNVCIFPEGNMSDNGESNEIGDAIGKLVKRSGAGLVTYRIDGGYFSTPRWASYPRRGRMLGTPVSCLTAAELEHMSTDAVNALIRKDLYVNAYQTQAAEQIPYKGKALAEKLELALYLCPRCHRISTLTSKDDLFFCSCGLSLRYTPQAYLESETMEPAPFSTVLEWDKWQRSWFAEHLDQYRATEDDVPIFEDEDRQLISVSGLKRTSLGSGRLSLYKDKLIFHYNDKRPPLILPFSEILGMQLRNQKFLIFSTINHRSYESLSEASLSSLKYVTAYRLLTGTK
ncbi:MAG: 1-acyl-sn-glycerol-3-phosphate acyltransferase [Bacillota bacterium]|nr:1-acyl-sn-glycerol-3-phosphate acyltransferase [Bacillota bacterium]